MAKVSLINSHKRWPWIPVREHQQMRDVLARVPNIAVYGILCKIEPRFTLDKVPADVIEGLATGTIEADTDFRALITKEKDKRAPAATASIPVPPPAAPKPATPKPAPPPIPQAAKIVVPPIPPADVTALRAFGAGTMDARLAAGVLEKATPTDVFRLLSQAPAPGEFEQGKDLASLLGKLDIAKLPTSWLAELHTKGIAAAISDRLLDVTLSNEKTFTAKHSPWVYVVFPAVKRLLDEPAPVPINIHSKIGKLRTFIAAEHWVIAAEVLCRAKIAVPARCIVDLCKWTNRDWRRWVSTHCEEPRWTFLTEFNEPPEWQADCRDLIDARKKKR